MKPISMHDVADALAHCDPQQLATALAQAGTLSVAHAAQVLEAATDLLATYPRQEVIAEADALLYDVLRWPIEDAVPGWERQVTPQSYAARKDVEVEAAAAALERLRRTETEAARALLAAGPIANYTLEQSQVTDCIEKLVAAGQVPTRDSVRRLALEHARASMRPGDGDSPIVYSIDEGLAPRILSPSPKVHAVIWLQRMEEAPPVPGILSHRLDYLTRAAETMGAAAAGHATVVDLSRVIPRHSPESTVSADLNLATSIGLVS